MAATAFVPAATAFVPASPGVGRRPVGVAALDGGLPTGYYTTLRSVRVSVFDSLALTSVADWRAKGEADGECITSTSQNSLELPREASQLGQVTSRTEQTSPI